MTLKSYSKWVLTMALVVILACIVTAIGLTVQHYLGDLMFIMYFIVMIVFGLPIYLTWSD